MRYPFDFRKPDGRNIDVARTEQIRKAEPSKEVRENLYYPLPCGQCFQSALYGRDSLWFCPDCWQRDFAERHGWMPKAIVVPRFQIPQEMSATGGPDGNVV
jgi:hypothetical protein